MKRILVVLLTLVVTAGSVSAQKDTTALKTAITSNFPDNTAGFITPARLRAVALDLMRSNANLLEDNVMGGKLEVADSIKGLDGFYRWNGSAWASIVGDTSAWARSGGFILPLDYTDTLSIEAIRLESVMYPNGGGVNLGKVDLPFDSIYVDYIGGGAGNHNTLDEAYDEGGSGSGREIIADSGAVWVSGEDGLLVTGTYGSGADSEWDGNGVVMFLNPLKSAFRAGGVGNSEWNNTNLGHYSSAIGNSVLAVSFSEHTVGMFSTNYTPSSETAWDAVDRIFSVGNGVDNLNRSDALIITKNGNLTMPTTTGAFSPPILTTTERNALTPTAGMMIYNSTTNKHQGYDGTSWNDLY